MKRRQNLFVGFSAPGEWVEMLEQARDELHISKSQIIRDSVNHYLELIGFKSKIKSQQAVTNG